MGNLIQFILRLQAKTYAPCPFTTAMTYLTLSIAVKHIASRINILTIEDICLAVAELATVKNADFDHGYHLLSWNQKSPPLSRRAMDRSRAIDSRMQVARVPTPCSPTAPYGVTDSRSIKYSVVKTPLRSLLVLANTIYNQVQMSRRS